MMHCVYSRHAVLWHWISGEAMELCEAGLSYQAESSKGLSIVFWSMKTTRLKDRIILVSAHNTSLVAES